MRIVCVNQQMVAGRQLGYYLLAEKEMNQERYGVKIEADDGESESILDVSVLECEILELIALLVRNTVTPISLRDVIDDWL